MAELVAESAHWGLALVPVLVMLGLFVWLDAFKLMSFGEILVLLLLGGIAALVAYPISGRFLDTLPIGFSDYSRFVAPWIEEALKAIVMIGLFRFNRIGYKLDAVISGFAVGAGFSVVENVLYLTFFPFYNAGTWLVRGLGTAVMHGTTLAVLAAIAHQLGERENREAVSTFDFRLWWFVPGYLAAVAIHTAFNQFPDRPLLAMVGAALFAPLAILGIFAFGTAEAQRWLATDFRNPSGTAGHAARGPMARRDRGQQDRRLGRPPRPSIGHAHPPLLGAAGLARRRSRGDDVGGSRRRCRFRFDRNPRRPCRTGRPQARARPKQLHRPRCAAALQPQRLLGARRAEAAGWPILTSPLTTC